MTLNWFSCLQSFCAQCVSRWPGWSCCCPRWNPYVWSPNPCKWTSPLMRAHSPFRDSVLLCFSDTKLASLVPITFLSAPSSHPVFRGSHSKLGSGTTFSRHLYLVPFPLISQLLLCTEAPQVHVWPCVFVDLFHASAESVRHGCRLCPHVCRLAQWSAYHEWALRTCLLLSII